MMRGIGWPNIMYVLLKESIVSQNLEKTEDKECTDYLISQAVYTEPNAV
jgi:hypothetical protein